MALPTWPTSLPKLRGLSQNGGSRELYAPPQETQFDDGPSRARRRSLFNETPLQMALPMTGAQFVAFKDFYLTALNRGARRFSAPVLLPDFATMDTRVCRITGAVAWSAYTPTKPLVSFTLTVQDW
ncbi:hypothetical protein DK419_13055 [Methylobacterium terrae]|uniref:Phage tail protein n=1 Tax=Methylobacterium terrae TaxID=2202827 RepID=A0A2U8WLJ7_9HYPH|nr:hypothetical protein [Methylobacterium terrae]AWN47125.1 hypothetical protein DK419_13055 [Methylobacterium terrae]